MSDNYNIFTELHLEKKETFHSAMIAAIASHDEKSQNAFFEMLSKAVNRDMDDRIITDHILDKKSFNNNFEELKNSIDRNNGKHRWIDNEVHLSETIKNETSNEYRDRGRADIWVGTNKDDAKPKYRLIIENKINAGNQYRQLRRYYRYLTGNNRENAGLFFLCVMDNDDFRQQAKYSAQIFNSESNGKEKDTTKFAIITYKDDIIPWLKEVINKAVGDFKKVVSDYLNLVESLVKNW